MLHTIPQKNTDIAHLSERQSTNHPVPVYIDYRRIVVNKPWGYEYLLFENKHVAIWILCLNKEARTSMHCHPKKQTSLVVLEGEVETSSLEGGHTLCALDGVFIDKATFHSTACTSETGAFVMEIETPPEKSDLVRLHDTYGREHKGYEKGADLSTDLDAYHYQDFHHKEAEERSRIEKVIKKSKLSLHEKEDWQSLYHEIQTKPTCLLSFLDTSLVLADGATALHIGQVCDGSWFLEQYANLSPKDALFTVLTIH